MPDEILGSSFRDPSGFVFERDGTLYRQVDRRYAADYAALMESGLHAELVDTGLLVAHDEVSGVETGIGDPQVVIRPERVPFVSYPYEWSFSQLKDAALLTLRLQKRALAHGMTLKDASAYNVQFVAGRPVFIDTLSFSRREEGSPWTAYRQFCQHFLAPLALMAYRDVRMARLLRSHLDGVPLDLARTLLPGRAWLNVNLFMHIRQHASYQRRYEGDTEATGRARPVTEKSLSNILETLRMAVRKLDWTPEGTEWAEYYDGDSYTDASAAHKRELVGRCLDAIAPASAWDLGANTGAFSRLAAESGIPTVAFDIDPACVERNYRAVRKEGETRVLPLLMDLSNPSPGLGWAHTERDSLVERGPTGVVMALALVHHLAIGNNVPLPKVAAFLAQLAEHVVIEFVPKSDPKVAILLATREDVFPDYTREGFESAVEPYFAVEEALAIRESDRILYRLRRRSAR
jgi:hypothetical protein